MKVKVLQIRISERFQHPDECMVNDFLERHEIVQMNAKLIDDETIYWSILIYYKDKSASSVPQKLFVASENDLSEDEKLIFSELRKWRMAKSKELQLMPFMICHNTHLFSIAKYKPQSMEEFLHIKGFNESKIRKYGSEIMEVLQNV
ncbi:MULTISPECIES: HRDC domain-containing protein [Chryseobacterium]|uniref:HRDC domain-containing protein n=1 Tax=Chryseobacterium sp. R2A-55 TaxID=2744445 RepID=UPI001F3D1E12|nr:HRDC domain-containing protein [Chryseobacterium sp. R2A-55]